MRGHWFALQANQWFFIKRKRKRIELVARPGCHHCCRFILEEFYNRKLIVVFGSLQGWKVPSLEAVVENHFFKTVCFTSMTIYSTSAVVLFRQLLFRFKRMLDAQFECTNHLEIISFLPSIGWQLITCNFFCIRGSCSFVGKFPRSCCLMCFVVKMVAPMRTDTIFILFIIFSTWLMGMLYEMMKLLPTQQ